MASLILAIRAFCLIPMTMSVSGLLVLAQCGTVSSWTTVASNQKLCVSLWARHGGSNPTSKKRRQRSGSSGSNRGGSGAGSSRGDGVVQQTDETFGGKEAEMEWESDVDYSTLLDIRASVEALAGAVRKTPVASLFPVVASSGETLLALHLDELRVSSPVSALVAVDALPSAPPLVPTEGSGSKLVAASR